MMKTFAVKLKSNTELLAYIIVGCLTMLVSLSTYFILVLTVLDPLIIWQMQLANVLSWTFAVLFAYVTNRKFVFKSCQKNWIREAASFFSSRIVTLLLDMLMMFFFVNMCGANDKIIKVITQVAVTVANYLLSKCFVFRR